MKPSKELFNLIKSLSKSEKRYFKLSSSLQSGDKNYMKLFDKIELQNEYDEEDIKKKFKGETFVKHLPSEKNHLYNLILKSLRGFHSDKSASTTIQEHIKNIELLFNKALYIECSKIIKKGKILAYKYEKFYYVLDLLDWEKRLSAEEFLRANFKRDVDAIITEEIDCFEKLRMNIEYKRLYSKLLFAIRKDGFDRNKSAIEIIEEINNHELVKGIKSSKTIIGTTYLYSFLGVKSRVESNPERTFFYYKKVVKLMEENPLIIYEMKKPYLRALYYIALESKNTKDWENCYIYIDKLKSLKKHPAYISIDAQMTLFTYTTNLELLLYIYLNKFTEAIDELIPRILQGIEQFHTSINSQAEMLFYLNVSRIYMGAKNFKLALKYINKVLNSFETDIRNDTYMFASLLNLIIHYELGNYDFLEYTIKSTKRKVDKTNNFSLFEIVFLKNLRKVIKIKKVDELKSLFRKFQEELLEVMNDSNENIENSDYVDFENWLASKVEDKTLRHSKIEK